MEPRFEYTGEGVYLVRDRVSECCGERVLVTEPDEARWCSGCGQVCQ